MTTITTSCDRNHLDNLIATNVSKDTVADFLDAFQPHPRDLVFAVSALGDFVRTAASPSLQTWDVVIVSGEGGEKTIAGQDTFARPKRTMLLGSADQNGDRELLDLRGLGRVASAADVANNLVAR